MLQIRRMHLFSMGHQHERTLINFSSRGVEYVFYAENEADVLFHPEEALHFLTAGKVYKLKVGPR